MRILVIGGTRFVGKHFVEQAVARGHDVTLFHRGRTGMDLFPDLAGHGLLRDAVVAMEESAEAEFIEKS